MTDPHAQAPSFVLPVHEARVAVQATFSARELIGYPVLNEQHERIGHVQDLLLDGGRVAFAVLSVGGFLGLEIHHVAVIFEALRIGDAVILPGATREALKATAAYEHQHRRLPSAREALGGFGEVVTSTGGEAIPAQVAEVTDGEARPR